MGSALSLCRRKQERGQRPLTCPDCGHVDHSCSHCGYSFQNPGSLASSHQMLNVLPRPLCLGSCFSFTLPFCDDEETAVITSIVVSDDNFIIVADSVNSKVKMVDMQDASKLAASVKLQQPPYRLALLESGLVAVATRTVMVYLLRIGEVLEVEKTITTQKSYWGVAGYRDDVLIAGCRHPACVDVINTEGDVLKTIIDDESMPGLGWTEYFCVDGDHLWVSEWKKHRVWRVKLDTGEVLDALFDVIGPKGIAADVRGNLYVASWATDSVMMRSRSGEMRQIMHGSQIGDDDRYTPWDVCVTGSLLVVLWWPSKQSACVITGQPLLM